MNTRSIRRTVSATLGLGLLVTVGCHDGGTLAETPTDAGVATPDIRMPDPDMRRLGDMNLQDGAIPDAAGDAVPAWDLGRPDMAPDAQPDMMPEPDMMPDAGVDPICVNAVELPEQPAIDLSARCRAPGAPLRIRDLRDARCPDYEVLPENQPGLDVELVEAVVTAVYDGDFTVQDPEGGTFAGLWVFTGDQVVPAGVEPGARVQLRGQILEFFTLTELVPEDNGGIVVLGPGEVPAPIFVADSARIEDGGDLVEPLENMLLELQSQRVTQTAPDCPRDFGMFVIAGASIAQCVSNAENTLNACVQACDNQEACAACDAAYAVATAACPKGLRVDDQAPLEYEPARGDVINRIIGTLHFSFEHQKLLPRGDIDLDTVVCGGLPDKCEETECPVLPDALESGALILTEIQNNPLGDDQLREFLEIYNPSPMAIAVDGWIVRDCAGNEAPLSGMIGPRSYKVLARQRDREINGGVTSDFGFGALFLPNGFGSVLIFDANNVLVDQVRYEPGGDVWPDRRPGQSLELIEAAADNRLGTAWAPGNDRYGAGGQGSPGRAYRE